MENSIHIDPSLNLKNALTDCLKKYQRKDSLRLTFHKYQNLKFKNSLELILWQRYWACYFNCPQYQFVGKFENMAISKIPPPRAKDKIRPVLSFCLSSGFFSLVLFEGGAGSFSLDFNWRMAD